MIIFVNGTNFKIALRGIYKADFGGFEGKG